MPAPVPLIDLHLHTTASDGRLSPAQLVARAVSVGITTLSVTDHDTTGAIREVAHHAAEAGIRFVPGIEVTAVHDGRDLHVLGYYLDPEAPGLSEFLSAQRRGRTDRAREIAAALARLGAPIDIERILATAPAGGGRAIARPQLAQGLVDAGHVATIAEAFDRFLGESSPAYRPHIGASPADAIAAIRQAGGIASLAHPGVHRRDALLPVLVDAGMEALEVFHSEHDGAAQAHYLALAGHYGLVATGGSDYHGEGVRRSEFFGRMTLPPEHFDRLERRASRRAPRMTTT